MSQISYTKKPTWNNDGLRPNHVNTNIIPTPMGWMAPMPGTNGKAITGATWSANTATFTATNHGLVNGQDVMVYGVTPSTYNGYFSAVTVVDANTFSVPLSVISYSPLSTPTLPSGTPSASGGTVAAATHYAKIVAVDGNGNTTLAGAESVGVTTTGSTSSIAWTWTAVTGAISYQIWVGTSAGAETSYFTSSTNSYTQTTSAGTAGTVPTSNPGTYVSGGTVANRGEIMYPIGGLDVINTDMLTVPVFSSVAFTYSALSHMVTGDVATVTITTSEPVAVNVSGGIPSVTLNVNTTPRQMIFNPALSSATSLVFQYTIVSGDVATSGQVTTGTTITLNGGQLIDLAPNSGNNASNHAQSFTSGTFVAPSTTTIAIN
jgi:hypothetical protein